MATITVLTVISTAPIAGLSRVIIPGFQLFISSTNRFKKGHAEYAKACLQNDRHVLSYDSFIIFIISVYFFQLIDKCEFPNQEIC